MSPDSPDADPNPWSQGKKESQVRVQKIPDSLPHYPVLLNKTKIIFSISP